MGEIRNPYGVPGVLTPVHAATIDISITPDVRKIVLNPTAAETLDFTIPTKIGTAALPDLVVGHQIMVHVIQDATGRIVTLGNNILAVAGVGVANDEDTIMLTWDGTQFIGGAWAKVVDAA